MEISLLTSFLGGVLALLSPCGALLLPAFFASSMGRRMQLLAHGSIFYLGLVVTLVPLGLGLGALGSLLVSYRDVLVIGTAVVLIALGLYQAAGFGFDMAKHLPGAASLQVKAHSKKGVLRTFLLGAASGVAGFCAGPILGAILTLAVAQGESLSAGVMLAMYGLGMVVPLVVLAGIWSRLSPKAIRALRGRTFTILGRQLHTTSFVTGLVIVGVGILFWTTNGLVSAPSLVPASVLRAAQSYSGVLATPMWDVVVIIAVVAIGVSIWGVRRAKRESVQPDSQARGEEALAQSGDGQS